MRRVPFDKKVSSIHKIKRLFVVILFINRLLFVLRLLRIVQGDASQETRYVSFPDTHIIGMNLSGNKQSFFKAKKKGRIGRGKRFEKYKNSTMKSSLSRMIKFGLKNKTALR